MTSQRDKNIFEDLRENTEEDQKDKDQKFRKIMKHLIPAVTGFSLKERKENENMDNRRTKSINQAISRWNQE